LSLGIRVGRCCGRLEKSSPGGGFHFRHLQIRCCYSRRAESETLLLGCSSQACHSSDRLECPSSSGAGRKMQGYVTAQPHCLTIGPWGFRHRRPRSRRGRSRRSTWTMNPLEEAASSGATDPSSKSAAATPAVPKVKPSSWAALLKLAFPQRVHR
jgi:hypothetical protein